MMGLGVFEILEDTFKNDINETGRKERLVMVPIINRGGIITVYVT